MIAEDFATKKGGLLDFTGVVKLYGDLQKFIENEANE